jgi:sec-independent protein translocase protein TatB
VGLSFGELLVIALIAVVAVGPKELPGLLRTLGRIFGRLRRALDDVRRDTGLEEVFRGDYDDLVRLADHLERIDETEPAKKQQLVIPLVADHELSEREYPRAGADCAEFLAEDQLAYPAPSERRSRVAP